MDAIISLLLLGIFFNPVQIKAEPPKIILDVDKPLLTKIPVAVPDFLSAAPGPVSGRDLAEIIRRDLYLTAIFQIVDPTPPISTSANGEPDFDRWNQAGVQVLILGSFQTMGDELTLEVRLYDVALKKLEIGKRYSGKIRDHRRMIHRFADRVMEKLTSVPGCFSTKIAFVGDSQSREVFSMDFDGHNPAQLTRNGSINLSPDWSPDGRNIVFTSYMNGNPDALAMDLSNLSLRAVSSRPGLNASPRYSPDSNSIALSMSFNGLPKLFIVTPQGNIIKRLTEGRGNDISPAWSPDGSAIAYVSDQAGTPQIYIVPTGGGQPRRLTFNGNYNTDPDWSPRGDLLAFTTRIEGRFQICTIRTDGTDLRVLTKTGSNQDPTWSPDGRFIAFMSERDGRRRIYIMDARGEIQVPVSPITGKCPAWSRHSW
ncbi:MAG: Tol-Pal system beta propeller repeat protein TolB [Desulfomonile tiedjei]|uniref:Tol-Pal system beta propeller repeat protein TolB n=1 Tax=Desulfomonile tiedjei TaxID=2358 RepID=A0A9D6Z4S0_9BACT|nr:Tol-Pal system beta propeller repeat protein TolB [Desulfomonile tiedjei]